jgi:hypothetical protein
MVIHLPEPIAPGKTGSSQRACPSVLAYLWSRAMRRRPARFSLLLALFAAIPATALASGDEHGLSYDVWLILAGMLLAAKLGGEIAVRLNQPAVLGELCAGIVLGNLYLVGIHTFDGAAELVPVEFLAELGVVLLLFEVGLESTLTEMRAVAPTSGLVAIIGVVAPMALGYGIGLWLIPDAPFSLHLFIGATLCATSVGITARVLKDLDAMARPETRVILGAAVIDDVLGLIVLAVVASIAEFGDVPGPMDLSIIIGLAGGFLIGALLLGAYVMPGVFRVASKLRTPDVLAAVAIGLCLLLAGISGAAGLAPIVGAFAARQAIRPQVGARPHGNHRPDRRRHGTHLLRPHRHDGSTRWNRDGAPTSRPRADDRSGRGQARRGPGGPRRSRGQAHGRHRDDSAWRGRPDLRQCRRWNSDRG